MKLFKTRNLMEMLTRHATDEERRGERNSKYLGYVMAGVVFAFLSIGVVTACIWASNHI